MKYTYIVGVTNWDPAKRTKIAAHGKKPQNTSISTIDVNWDESDAQYREGSVRHTLAQVLKGAGYNYHNAGQQLILGAIGTPGEDPD